MRPLKLSMQAFGPFAGREEIDFTAFGDNAFFLIHGPTGAGKTSILDAICYALYGSPSGSTREERSLRSQHAPGELLCEVEFIFGVGPRRYRIRRNPDQAIERKGREQKVGHKVELCRIDEQGEFCGERLVKVGEVRSKVEEILGFTAEQFSQVVILPQGEFRRLLLAGSGEKERILERLFATERFKRIEQLLKERRDTLARSLEGLRNTAAGILEAQEAASVEELTSRGADLAEEEQGLRQRILEGESALREAAEALRQGHLIAGQFQRLERARLAVAALEERRESMEALAARAEAGRRAASLADLDDALRGRRNRLSELTQQVQRLDDEITELNSRLKSVAARRDGLRQRSAEIPAWSAEAVGIEGRIRVLEELERLTAELAAAGKRQQSAATRKEAAEAELRGVEEQLAVLTGTVESLTAVTARTGELEQRLKEAVEAMDSRRQLELRTSEGQRLAAERGGLEERLAAAEKRLADAIAAEEKLTRAMIGGQASRLARNLCPGEPCPVCGSENHPSPARGDEDVPAEAELERTRSGTERARAAVEAARSALAAHDIRLAEARSAWSELRRQLGDRSGVPIDELAGAMESLRKERDLARAGMDELERCRARRKQLEEQGQAARARLADAAATLQDVVSVVAKTTGERDGRLKELEGETRDLAALHSRITELRHLVAVTGAQLKEAEAEAGAMERGISSTIGQREEAARGCAECGRQVREEEERFQRRRLQAGFETQDTFHAARLPVEELESMERELQSYRDEAAAALQERSQAEETCNGVVPPDLAALTDAHRAAEASVRDFVARLGGITSRLEGVGKALETLENYSRESREQEEKLKVAGHLATLASGGNPRRITLQRFVLASLFEEVALAASGRLSRMTRGRYHLRRSETVEDARRGGGLDLEVTDDFTGLSRPASSLSGGETFLASLSLALGLSDVVLAQSGGRYLDTLFIDEGFGTLDPETLEVAMDTLVRLNEQGRMVGIISHVAELKEQIPSRLEVMAGRNGSKVRVMGR